jgi:hypothetical protein
VLFLLLPLEFLLLFFKYCFIFSNKKRKKPNKGFFPNLNHLKENN